jgi:hypothetical protein
MTIAPKTAAAQAPCNRTCSLFRGTTGSGDNIYGMAFGIVRVISRVEHEIQN